jgi:hypothetical protein
VFAKERIRCGCPLLPRFIGTLVSFLQTTPKDHRSTDVVVLIAFFGYVLEHDL